MKNAISTLISTSNCLDSLGDTTHCRRAVRGGMRKVVRNGQGLDNASDRVERLHPTGARRAQPHTTVYINLPLVNFFRAGKRLTLALLSEPLLQGLGLDPRPPHPR